MPSPELGKWGYKNEYVIYPEYITALIKLGSEERKEVLCRCCKLAGRLLSLVVQGKIL